MLIYSVLLKVILNVNRAFIIKNMLNNYFLSFSFINLFKQISIKTLDNIYLLLLNMANYLYQSNSTTKAKLRNNDHKAYIK